MRRQQTMRSIRTSSFVSLTFSTALRRNALKIFRRLAGGRPFPFHFAYSNSRGLITASQTVLNSLCLASSSPMLSSIQGKSPWLSVMRH